MVHALKFIASVHGVPSPFQDRFSESQLYALWTLGFPTSSWSGDPWVLALVTETGLYVCMVCMCKVGLDGEKKEASFIVAHYPQRGPGHRCGERWG